MSVLSFRWLGGDEPHDLDADEAHVVQEDGVQEVAGVRRRRIGLSMGSLFSTLMRGLYAERREPAAAGRLMPNREDDRADGCATFSDDHSERAKPHRAGHGVL